MLKARDSAKIFVESLVYVVVMMYLCRQKRKENKRDRATRSAMCQNHGSLLDIAGVQDRLGYSSNYNTKPR